MDDWGEVMPSTQEEWTQIAIELIAETMRNVTEALQGLIDVLDTAEPLRSESE